MNAIPACVLFVLALAWFSPYLLGAWVLGGVDRQSIWYPLMASARESFREDGVIPFWIREILAGIPFGESLVPSLYYPTDILGWLTGIPVESFYAWDACLHIAIAGLGVWRLAVTLGSSSLAGLTGGVSFMFCGYLVSQLAGGTAVFIRGTALLPWLLVAVERAIAGKSWYWWTCGAFFAGLLLLTSCFQLFAYVTLVVPLYVLATAGVRRTLTIAPVIACVFLLAALFSAVTFLPALRYFTLSMRAATAYGWSGMDPVRMWDIPLFLLPETHIWFASPFSMERLAVPTQAKYLEIVPLGLAVLACWRDWRRCRTWLVIGFTAVVLSLGPQTLVGRALASLPLWGSFRVSSHWIVFLQLAVSVLAASGIDAILADARHGLKRLSLVFGSAALLLLLMMLGYRELWERLCPERWPWAMSEFKEQAVAQMLPVFRAAMGRTAVVGIILSAACAVFAATGLRASRAAAILLGVAALDAAGRATPIPHAVTRAEYLRERTAFEPHLPFLQRQQESFRIFSTEKTFLLNQRIPLGLEWVQGYHGAPLGVFQRFHDGAGKSANPVRVLAWLNIRYFVVRGPATPGTPGVVAEFRSTDGRAYVVTQNPYYLPRVLFVTHVFPFASDGDTLRQLSSASAGTIAAFIECPGGECPKGRSAPGRVLSFRQIPNALEAMVSCSGRGFVVFSEIFYPAWSAFVDGIRVPVYRTNIALRGVCVGPGLRRIEMSFQSIPFKIGLLISVMLWFVFLASAVLRLAVASLERFRLKSPLQDDGEKKTVQ